jgi:hypothetical protein
MLPPYTTLDTIHDQAQPTRVLRAIYNSLSSDLMRDIAASSALHENIDNALAPALYSISTIHCMTVSLAYNGERLGTMGNGKGGSNASRYRVHRCSSQNGWRRHNELLLHLDQTSVALRNYKMVLLPRKLWG